MSQSDGQSETSPLLKAQDRNNQPGDLEPINENSALETGQADDNNIEEQESVDESRAAQFAGNPELRKTLKYILPALSVGVFLAAADQTIIVSSYGRIGSELNALNLTNWIATSYFLTLTSFQPLYGKLSDIFGRKSCLLIAYAIFGLGVLFCGLSRNINELIAARVVQGIGGGGMTTVVSILFSDIVPLKDRGMWQGVLNIIYASGAASGAPLGGILADSIGWRWSFIGQAPLCLVAFVAVFFVLDNPKKDTQDWKKNLRRVDFLGAFVLVAAVFGLIFGMDRGSNDSWLKPISYAPLVLSFVFFALFVFVESNVASEPFAPGHLIFEGALFACYMCVFFSFASWLSVLYYLPLFFQALDGLGATGAAVRLLPAILASVLGSLFGGYILKKTGRYYWVTVVAYSLLPIGILITLLFTGIVRNNTFALTIGVSMAGFGNGIGVTCTLIAIISYADPEDQAIATACSYLFRSLGSVIGISLSATIIQQYLRKALEEKLGSNKDAANIERGVRQSLDYIKTLEPHVQKVVRDSYGTAMTHGFALMLALSVGATIASFFIKERRLSR